MLLDGDESLHILCSEIPITSKLYLSRLKRDVKSSQWRFSDAILTWNNPKLDFSSGFIWELNCFKS